MTWIQRAWRKMCGRREKLPRLLYFLILVGFIVRVIGITYGLPLWIVPDEPNILFGTLKLIELKTLIPSLHAEALTGTFYYMPLLVYVQLLPFVGILLTKLLFFGGTMAEFPAVVQQDLSAFFLSVRLTSALVGTATLFVLYKVTLHVSESKNAALFSILFLALSPIHVLFSHWGKTWSIAVLFMTVVIYFLTHPTLSKEKKYMRATIAAAFSAGFAFQLIAMTAFIFFWFVIEHRKEIGSVVQKAWPWKCLGVYAIFLLALYLLWPFGFALGHGSGFPVQGVGDAALLVGRTFLRYVQTLLDREILLPIFLVIGIGVSWKRQLTMILSAGLFLGMFLSYLYGQLPGVSERFLLIGYPFFCVFAGIGVASTLGFLKRYHQAVGYAFIAFVIFFQFLPVAALDTLLVKNDTRVLMRDWIIDNMEPGSRIAVLVPSLRLPTTQSGYEEQWGIDETSKRSVEESAYSLSEQYQPTPSFHVLNLESVSSSTLFAELIEYLTTNDYDAVLYAPDYAIKKGVSVNSFDELGDVVKEYDGYNIPYGKEMPIDGGSLGLKTMYSSAYLGPNIILQNVQ